MREQEFLSGSEPAYPDYVLMGTMMWSRTVSPAAFLERDDPLTGWVGRMLDRFDGFARRAAVAT